MKLTKDNYHSPEANWHYMSVSQFKAFEKCPAAAMAELRGEYQREKTTALLVGSYVDSYFEGTLKEFKEENPEIFKKNGELKAEYCHAEKIIERVKQDKLFMHYMSGLKQVIMTGNIKGVPVKIKIDSLLKEAIVDGKIVKDFEPIYVADKGKVPWFEAWGYDLQGAVYQEIVLQNIGKQLPFYLAPATKEKEPNIDVIHIGQLYLDYAMEHFEEKVALYDAIKKGILEPERCEKCEYCKRTKILTAPTEAEEYYFID